MNEVETPVIALQLQTKQHQRKVGVAARLPRARHGLEDKVCWTFLVYEFLDNDQLSNLDSLLVQLGPSKCYLTFDKSAQEGKPKGDMAKLLTMMDGRNVTVANSKAACFRTTDLGEHLRMLLGGSSMIAQHVQEADKPVGMSCVACLISELRLADGPDPDMDAGAYELLPCTLDQFMKLDSAAAEAVTLLPDPAFPHQYGSLFSILNLCKTKMGSRMLERWLRQPLTNKEQLEQRHDMVQLFRDDTVLRKALREHLRSTQDLDVIKTKMQRKNAGLEDIVRLAQFVWSMPDLLDVLQSCETPSPLLESKFVQPATKLLNDFQMLRKLVDTVIDKSQLPDVRVNPDYSEELRELHDEIEEVRGEAARLHTQAANGWCNFNDGKAVNLETDNNKGFYLRINNTNRQEELKKRQKNLDFLAILKNGLHFTWPQLEALSTRHKDLHRRYLQQQQGLEKNAVATASTYLPVVEEVSQLVAELDVLLSFGDLAALAPGEYTRPVMREQGSGVLDVRGGRHPCLEFQDSIEFIPNSYRMSKDKSRFVIITGPNMGGKSTYIRALGAIVVMAQIGSFVPAESAEISIVDAVFARMGASDAQQKGVSTFMAEMLEASAILNSATEDSLIIIDELGRGTSTFDGFGLAWGISEYIVKQLGAFTLFATHFHEMTTLADKEPCVANMHVTAQTTENKITMLYEVKEGPCLQSFGIHVAQMAQFPGSVIREAKRKADVLESFESALERYEEEHGAEDGTTKRRRSSGELPEGGKRLHCLADQFRGLPLDLMQDGERVPAVTKMVRKLYEGA